MMEKPFNLDRHVFNILLLSASLSTMVLCMGISVPAWFVVHENVRNFTSCMSLEYVYYVTNNVINLNSLQEETVTVTISASLWFIKLRINTNTDDFQTYLPFSAIPNNGKEMHLTGEGIVETDIFSRHYVILVVIIFLISALVFSFRSSTRPSQVIYYGLSTISLVTGIILWVATAIPNSQNQVISMVTNMCIQDGIISSSIFIQTVTGSAAILSFVFGCILLHVAIVINTRLKTPSGISDIFQLGKSCEKLKNNELQNNLIDL